MSQLQAILNYQKIDEELFALERELSSSKERKEYVQAKKFLMSAAEKLDLLDVKAKQLESEVATLSQKAAEAEETLKDFSNVDELLESGADVAFYKKNALALLEEFKRLKAGLSALTATISTTDEEYKKLKKQVLTMQKQYKEAQEKYAAVKDSKEGDKQAIEARLKEAEKAVPAELMERYLNKRKDKVFPVVGQLTNKRYCPYCGLELLSIAAANQFTADSTIECDSCHRILYGE